MLKKDDLDKQMVYYQVHSKCSPRADTYRIVGRDRDVHISGVRHTAYGKDFQSAR